MESPFTVQLDLYATFDHYTLKELLMLWVFRLGLAVAVLEGKCLLSSSNVFSSCSCCVSGHVVRLR